MASNDPFDTALGYVKTGANVVGGALTVAKAGLSAMSLAHRLPGTPQQRMMTMAGLAVVGATASVVKEARLATQKASQGKVAEALAYTWLDRSEPLALGVVDMAAGTLLGRSPVDEMFHAVARTTGNVVDAAMQATRVPKRPPAFSLPTAPPLDADRRRQAPPFMQPVPPGIDLSLAPLPHQQREHMVDTTLKRISHASRQGSDIGGGLGPADMLLMSRRKRTANR